MEPTQKSDASQMMRVGRDRSKSFKTGAELSACLRREKARYSTSENLN
jgi:hypothetical protein